MNNLGAKLFQLMMSGICTFLIRLIYNIWLKIEVNLVVPPQKWLQKTSKKCKGSANGDYFSVKRSQNEQNEKHCCDDIKTERKLPLW